MSTLRFTQVYLKSRPSCLRMFSESERSLFGSSAGEAEVEEVDMREAKPEHETASLQPADRTEVFAADPSDSDVGSDDAGGNDSDVVEDVNDAGDRFVEGVRSATTRSKGRLAPRKKPQHLNSRVSDWKREQRDRASRLREKKLRLEQKHVTARELHSAAIQHALFDRSDH